MLELITPTGATYNLSNRLHFSHLGNDRFGMAPVRRLSQAGPLQHGVTDLGFRLQPRTIQLVLLALATTDADYWTRRDTLLEAFAPRDLPLQLRYRKPGGVVRQIDCHVAGELSFGATERFGTMQRVGVTLVCPDPTWYDPVQTTLSVGVAASANAMNVPLSIPWNIGSSTVDQTVTLAYGGSWQSSPTVVINGPLTNPLVRNLTTGETLRFVAGTTIAAGDSYTIDTRYGLASVVDAAGANQISRLADDADLTTFRLASTTQVAGGLNTIQVTGTAATATTNVFLRFFTRYLGI